MVTVPVYEQTETLRPQYRQGIDVQSSPDDFGAAIGRGIQGLAQGGMQLADSFKAVADLRDTTAAKDSLTAFQREKMELDYGQNGFLTKQGRNAVEGREEYNRALEELKKKHAPQSGMAAKKYNDAATGAVTDGMRTGIMHSAQGQKDWAASSSTARMELLKDQALSGYDKPDEIKKNVGLGFAEIDAQAALMGWGPEVVALKRQEFSSSVHSNVAMALASKPNGARSALEYIKTNGAGMDPKTKMEMEEKLRPFAADEEGLSIVDKIMGQGRKVSDAPSGESAARASAEKPSAAPTVEAPHAHQGGGGPTRAKAFLMSKSAHKERAGDTGNLDNAFADNLAALIQDAPPHIRDGLGIGSGWRSNERQKQLFEASNKSGKMVAFPAGYKKPDGSIAKGSNHLHGRAADLTYNGVFLNKAPKEVRDWVHENAGAYGLRFPMSWEAWHIEPIKGGGGGGRGATASVGMGAGPTVVPSHDGVAARSTMPSYGDAIAQVNQISDPQVRASAMRQLNAQFEVRGKAEAARADEAKTQIWTQMMQGTPMSAIPLELKIAAGREAVSGFMDFEGKSGNVKTDPTAYSTLTTMAATDPVTFSKIDMTAPEIINSLSREDWKAMSDKKTSILGDERKAREDGLNVTAAFSQASTSLEAIGITASGKDGAKREEAAKRIAAFNNALISEMETFKKLNAERPPSQPEIQQMVNKLLLPIVIKQERSGMNPASWFGSSTSDTEGKFAFEAGSRPDGSTVDVAVQYGDIPIDLRRGIATDLERDLGRKPSEEEVIQRYEDFVLNR